MCKREKERECMGVTRNVSWLFPLFGKDLALYLSSNIRSKFEEENVSS